MRRATFTITAGLAVVMAIIAGPAPVAQYQWNLPPRVPAPRVPGEWPMTPGRVELGRHLFYDKRLSGNGTQSCGTCHLQERAFTDGKAQGLGSTGMLHARSPMSLVNTAYHDALTWANPTLRVLETQVLVPLFGTTPVELGLAGHEPRVYAALTKDPLYRRLFAAAFPGDTAPVTTPHVAAALSAFVRSIVSFRSPFDLYRQNEDPDALSESAKRGLVLFFSNRKARCSNCHRGLNLDGGAKTVESPTNEGEVFQFHNTALYNLPGPTRYPPDNTGLYEHTGAAADMGKFRIPTLRNIAVTAPYMHDGSIATLERVLDHYVAGGRTANPDRTTALSPLTMTAAERLDLLAFLESLTDTDALRDPRWSDPWK